MSDNLDHLMWGIPEEKKYEEENKIFENLMEEEEPRADDEEEPEPNLEEPAPPRKRISSTIPAGDREWQAEYFECATETIEEVEKRASRKRKIQEFAISQPDVIASVIRSMRAARIAAATVSLRSFAQVGERYRVFRASKPKPAKIVNGMFLDFNFNARTDNRVHFAGPDLAQWGTRSHNNNNQANVPDQNASEEENRDEEQ